MTVAQGREWSGSGAGVALGAADRAMDRVLGLGRVDKHGHFLAVAVPHQIRLAVAFHALVVGHALFVEDPPNLVGPVAVDTGRDFVRFLLPQLASNDFPVHLLDAPVALLAGLGDIVAVDARFGSVCGSTLWAV